MPAEKSSFYTSDLDRSVLDSKTPGKQTKYMGQERRVKNRRMERDRRIDVRFSITNSDRRKLEGRRESDAVPKFW